jgi:superoxide dismutase, Fe-Mn family
MNPLNQLPRREFLAQSSAAVLAGGVLSSVTSQARANQNQSAGFTLPKLPYAYDALEPIIDKQTMTIHHTKHHQGYVDKLNAALESEPDLAAMSIEQLLAKLDSLPENVRTAVRNNGGGHANHSLFWKCMTPKGSDGTTVRDSKLSQAIESGFGSFDKLKEQFSAAGGSQFGSGWAWLVAGDGKLEIMSTPNQDSPLSMGKTPLLGLDVWEHAYYLKYQNRRADYISAWWDVVNWQQVSKNFAAV